MRKFWHAVIYTLQDQFQYQDNHNIYSQINRQILPAISSHIWLMD